MLVDDFEFEEPCPYCKRKVKVVAQIPSKDFSGVSNIRLYKTDVQSSKGVND